MLPESRKLLADMLDAAGAVERFSAGKRAADLAADELLRVRDLLSIRAHR